MFSHRTGGSGKISLAYFLNTTVRAGVEEHVLSLLRGLDPEAFEVSLIAPPQLVEMYGGDIPGHVAVMPLEVASFAPAKLRPLHRFLRGHQVDILHSHMFQSSLYSAPVAWRAGVPLFIETTHVSEQWRRGLVKGNYFIDRCVARFVDYFIAVSHANARYLIGRKGIPARKVVVIHNGRDLEAFRPDWLSREQVDQVRASASIGPEDPVIAVVARLEPQKGHGVLLDAVRELLPEFPRLKVLLIGDGALRGELEKRVGDEQLSQCVKFLGYKKDVQTWLAVSDLFVLPSFYEGLPLVAIEASAMEKAIVATAVDGTPEVVLNGETGLTVAPGNSAELAEAIQTLLADPGLRSMMGQAGRRHVLRAFTEKQQVARTTEFYAQALRDRRGSVPAGSPGERETNFEVAAMTTQARAKR